MEYYLLRLHTRYSPLLSLLEPDALARALSERGIRGGAIVDRGSMFGWAESAPAFAEEGVAHFGGAEVEVLFPAPGDGIHRSYTLTLFPESIEGRRNLGRILSFVWKDRAGLAEPGALSLQELELHAAGLIALSGGLTGPVSGPLARGRMGESSKNAGILAAVFDADHFYLEVSRTGSDGEELAEPFLQALEKRHGIARVAADPVRYLARGDDRRLRALRAILPPDAEDSAPDPLLVEGDAHLPSASELVRRYGDDIGPLQRAAEIAERSMAAFREPARRPREIEPDNLIRECQAEIARRYGHLPAWKRKELRNRFWGEFWKLEEASLSSLVRELSRLARMTRSADVASAIHSSFLSGSLITHLTGFHELDPVEWGMGMPVLETDGDHRLEIDIEADASSASRFLRLLSRTTATCVLPRIEPVPLSDSDRQRLLAVDRSMGEGSGLKSLRSTHNRSFRAQNREKDRPDPLPSIAPDWTERAVMSYRCASDAYLCGDAPEDRWFRDRGALVRVLATRTMGALAATFGLPEEADAHRLVRKGNWTGLVDPGRILPHTLVRDIGPRSVEDLAILLAAGYHDGRGNLARRIAKTRSGESRPLLAGQGLDELLGDTEGLPFYQEQAIALIDLLTGLGPGAAEKMFHRIRTEESTKLAGDRALFLRRTVDRGHSLAYAQKVFSALLSIAPHTATRGSVIPRALLLRKLGSRKASNPGRFAERILNASLRERKRVHHLLDGFRKEGMQFLPVDLQNSVYGFLRENESLRSGFVLIPGMTPVLGERLVAERQRGGAFRSVADLLARMAAAGFPRPPLVRLAKALDTATVKSKEAATPHEPADAGDVPERKETAPKRRGDRRRGRGPAGPRTQIELPFSEMTGTG